jgi:cation transport ATPase
MTCPTLLNRKSLVVAALAMSLSSVSVIGNALRLKAARL